MYTCGRIFIVKTNKLFRFWFNTQKNKFYSFKTRYFCKLTAIMKEIVQYYAHILRYTKHSFACSLAGLDWPQGKHSITIFQLGIPPGRCCHFVNSSGPGSKSLCHHNISKNPSDIFTLLSLPNIVNISLIISIVWTGVGPQVWSHNSCA